MGLLIKTLVMVSLWAHARPMCGADVLPTCADLAQFPIDASKTFGVQKDGGVVFNGQAYWLSRGSSQDLSVMRAENPTRVKRARDVAESLKLKAIDFVRSQMPDSAERRELIARFTNVVIDTTTNPPGTCDDSAVPPGFPNAGYLETDHKLYICSAATNLTEVQLTHLLIHELGHVAAPCVTKTSDAFSATKACIYNQVKPALSQLPSYRLAIVEGQSPKQALAHLKQTHDDICSDAFDEAFADRFSAGLLGHVSETWTPKDFQISLLSETGFTCFASGRQLTMSRYQNPKIRLSAMLNDPHIAERLQCDQPKDKTLCPLQFTFKGSKPTPPKSQPAIR